MIYKKIFGHDNLTDDNGLPVGRYNKTWVEESIYLEKQSGHNVPMSSGSNSHVGTSFNKNKFKNLLIFISIFILVIVSRLFYLQILRGSYFRQSAENNRQRIIPIPAERGTIFDRNDIALTKNIPNFSLAIIPQDLPRMSGEKNQIIEKLSSIIKRPQDELRQIIQEYGSYSYESIIIQENLDYNSALSILIASQDLPGIEIRRGSKRMYLNTFLDDEKFSYVSTTISSLPHIIGYLGKLSKNELSLYYPLGYLPMDSLGKMGLEKSYEDILRGKYGRRRIEVNAIGREQTILAEDAPYPGQHLRLTIDVKIQSALDNIINKNLFVSNKKRASVIVMNPQNGEVLGMVSMPSFDNNLFSNGISFDEYKLYNDNQDQPLFNRAIGGIFPSGSSIKPAIASTALQSGIINNATSFLSSGGLQIGDWFFPDWQAGGHGITNVRKSLAWSVNTFYYYIGGGYNNFIGLGVEKIVEYLKMFGFSQKTGIDIPNEADGFLPSKEWKQRVKNEKWYIGDTYNLSIGQGDILVTPLQIANMTSAIANGGNLYQPHLLKETIDPITKIATKNATKILNTNFISPSNLNIVQLGMMDCVIYGSCRRLGALPFSSAGKTGTAQWNSNKENHAWFTSFAPFEKPEIVVTVLVEEGGEGSGIAGMIAYDFYKWWGQYRQRSL